MRLEKLLFLRNFRCSHKAMLPCLTTLVKRRQRDSIQQDASKSRRQNDDDNQHMCVWDDAKSMSLFGNLSGCCRCAAAGPFFFAHDRTICCMPFHFTGGIVLGPFTFGES